jgi:hypothetical protein
MELTIRPASVDDHMSVHEILMSPHVLRGTMRVPQSPLEQTRERLTPPRGVSSSSLKPPARSSASPS